MFKYCGVQIYSQLPKSDNVTLPSIQNKFGQPNLFCQWKYSNLEEVKYVSIAFEDFILNSKNYFAFEISMKNGNKLFFNVNDRKFIWESALVSEINFYFLSGAEFSSVPFEMRLDVTHSKINDNLDIIIPVITLSLLILFCILVTSNHSHKFKLGVLKNLFFNNLEAYNRNIDALDMASESRMSPTTVVKKVDVEIMEGMLKFEIEMKKFNEITTQCYDNSCTICLEEFKDNSEVTVVKCKHIFHRVCFNTWMYKNFNEPKCPNCKYALQKEEEYLSGNFNYIVEATERYEV